MVSSRIAVAVVLHCAATAVSATSFCDEAGWSRVWHDEFDGSTLDSSSWTVLNNTTENDSSCREAMCVTENVAVTGGALVLTARNEPRGWAKWTTGAVNSQGKRYWQATSSSPFRLCVSGRLPGANTATGAGLWPAFWLMPNDNSCWPDHGEHDLMEMIDADGNVHASYHYSPGPVKCQYKDASTTAYEPISTFETAYHEYAIERTTTYYAYVYDGVTVYNSTGTSALVFDVPWYVILNFAIGGPWPHPVNNQTLFPVSTLVDYVRVSTRN